MRFGAHVSRKSAGVAGAVSETKLRGADAAQIFISNPRGWAPPRYTDEEAAAFREGWAASGLGPLIAHSPYLVNIASPKPDMLAKSRGLAVRQVETCEQLGVDVIVFHSGAGGPGEPGEALERAAATLRIALESSSATTVSVELMAGTAGAVASKLSEAARLLEGVGDERLAITLDTCHLFAAGYALNEAAGVSDFFDELKSLDLTDRVAAVHANDSMYPSGEHRDRHENIGDGHIGIDGWCAILGRPEVSDWTFILETPGDAERQGRDIETLRVLA